MIKQTLALIGLTLSLSANAATVVYSAPNTATAITGLVIGSSTYNVDFEAAPPYVGNVVFWSDMDEADAAITAIVGVFNAQTTPNEVFKVTNAQETIFVVQYSGNTTGEDRVGVSITEGDWVQFGALQNSTGSGYTAWTLVAPVPLPAAAWLFGSALLGLAGVARRKRV